MSTVCLNDYIHQLYCDMLEQNQITQEQFKEIFKDKNPVLKFRVDFEYTTVYIGDENVEKDIAIVEIAKIKTEDIINDTAYKNYVTHQCILCAVYALDILVGFDNNPIRDKVAYCQIDCGLNELIKENICENEKISNYLLNKILRNCGRSFVINNCYSRVFNSLRNQYAWLDDKFIVISMDTYVAVCSKDHFDSFADKAWKRLLINKICDVEMFLPSDLKLIVMRDNIEEILILE